VQVSINAAPAPLLYVSVSQINAVTPFSVTVGASAILEITVNSVPLSTFRLFVDAAAPQIFRNSSGYAAAINQNGTVNSAGSPAKMGSVASVWATGAAQPGGIDGQMQTAAQSTCGCGIQISATPTS
jgi:uncharacterized protein (TIGR03437 family)